MVGQFILAKYSGLSRFTFRLVWRSKCLRLRWLLSNGGFPFLRQPGRLVNLVSSFDYRKAVDVGCLTISLLIVNAYDVNTGVAYDLLLATAAAAIFDIFITVLPREQAKAVGAYQIFKALSPLVELKNYQYQMLGYLPDPFWLAETERTHDQAMSQKKGQQLMTLMAAGRNQQSGGLASSALPLRESPNETIGEFFIRAHAFFQQWLEQLAEVVKAQPDLFPQFTKALDETLAEIHKPRPPCDLIRPDTYVTEHFKAIECLQMYFTSECHRYVGYEFDTPLTFSPESIQGLMHPEFQYYNLPPELMHSGA